MARALRIVCAALVLLLLASLALPWLQNLAYAWQLSSMAAPTALPIPVAGLTRKSLTDTWHATRPPNRRHEGIDIFARKGTPVVSNTEGIVLRRGENQLGGKVVWVLGPGGLRHYYAHLDGFADVQAGKRVQVGTLLGYVGNTGNARTTPPHLHYGVYAADGAINPYPLLAAAQPNNAGPTKYRE